MNLEKDYSNNSENAVPAFVTPNIDSEKGEVERAAKVLDPGNEEEFALRFMEMAANSELVPMDDALWEALENTDSLNIKLDDWEEIDRLTKEENPLNPRDWRDLKRKMERKIQVDAPIVCQVGGKLHLVSGNTRLMVARALGIDSLVLLVTMD